MDQVPRTLPIFPLHTVLFPGQPLPLHIFEPRYREMIGECLEHRAPFGVVLIQSGREVGEAAEPFRVGTTAEIVRAERHPDGRMHVVAVGRARFRIRVLLTDRAFLRAEVDPLTDLAPLQTEVEPPSDRGLTAASDAAAAELRAALAAFVADLGVAAPRLPDEPERLAFAVAAMLPLPLDQAQAVLESTDLADRLRIVRHAIEREHGLRHSVGETRPASPTTLGRISPN